MSLPLPALGPAFRSRREQAGVPPVTVTLAVRAHVAADKATLATFRRLRKPPSDDAWDRIVKEAHLARDHFARAGWLDDLRSYHGVPEPLTNPQLRPSRVARLRVERMKFPTSKQWNHKTLTSAARSYADGSSLADVAAQFGLDPSTVANRFRRAGIPIRPRRGWDCRTRDAVSEVLGTSGTT
jgi:hypothetical protein